MVNNGRDEFGIIDQMLDCGWDFVVMVGVNGLKRIVWVSYGYCIVMKINFGRCLLGLLVYFFIFVKWKKNVYFFVVCL